MSSTEWRGKAAKVLMQPSVRSWPLLSVHMRVVIFCAGCPQAQSELTLLCFWLSVQVHKNATWLPKLPVQPQHPRMFADRKSVV